MGSNKDARMKAFLRLGDEIHFGLKPKVFNEGDNPGEILHRQAMDIMMLPQFTDSINYSKALAIACERNPALAAKYIQLIEQS